MKKTFSKKKSAFSLIELSIVLIVIGLLIAGITGGASLIKSSELRSVMGEARGFGVAVNAFYSQFNALPGDYNTVIGNSYAGDNDGKIEYYAASTHGAALTGSESSNAWIALRAIGAVDSVSGSATPTIATTAPVFTGTTPTAPASKIKSSGWVFDYRDATAAPYTDASGTIETASSLQNTVILTGTVGTGATAGGNAAPAVTSAAILSSDALSIDAKIDDGNAGTGKVRGVNPTLTVVPAASATASSTNCYYYSSGFVYNTTNATKSCALSYQIDVNS